MAKSRRQRYAERYAAFMPNGVPKYIRVYDNLGESLDCFTVVFSGVYRDRCCGGEFLYITMNAVPYHPQMGICMHGSSRTQIDAPQGWPPAIGRKCRLGRRIRFTDLPEDCQKAALEDYFDIWDLQPPELQDVKPFSQNDIWERHGQEATVVA